MTKAAAGRSSTCLATVANVPHSAADRLNREQRKCHTHAIDFHEGS